jgi:outer membrane protein OmpA-like peptidoglycan-associated protein
VAASLRTVSSVRAQAAAAAAVVAALVVAGCAAGRSMHERGEAVKATVKSAKELGSPRCMPRETAIAEANAEFTVDEADDGNYYAAEEHFSLAKPNADAALEFARKNPEKCLPPKIIIAPPPPPKPVVIDKCKLDADGDGVGDCDDKCPALAGPDHLGGCPDGDGDGIADTEDKCPVEPGLSQYQGCPDTDLDQIPNPEDKCPFQPGVADTQDPSKHGCPKFTLVVVKKGIIEIKEQVLFETGRSVIKPDSFELLRQVAQVMRDNPEFNVEVQGHTDNVGGKAYNQKLSDERSKSVRHHLIVREGIAAGRLLSKGYGLEKPIASNSTAMGRTQNRRVEFRIISGQDDGGKKDQPVIEEIKPKPKPRPKAKPKPKPKPRPAAQ